MGRRGWQAMRPPFTSALFRVEAVEAENHGSEVDGALAGDEMGWGDFVEVAVAALDDAESQEGEAVFGDVGGGDAEAGGEFLRWQGFALEQFVEDAPASHVGDGGEDVFQRDDWHGVRWHGNGFHGAMRLVLCDFIRENENLQALVVS